MAEAEGDSVSEPSEKDYYAAARTLIRLADKSVGYLEGYDDGMNDALRWLSENHSAVCKELVREIQKASEGKSRPIKIRKEFL